MPELLRSIVTRLRAYVGERRRAPRYRLRLPCAVFIHDPRLAGERARRAPRLDAFTRDLSRTGLALIAPAIRIGERYLTDSTLQLVLEHPTGPLELLATPVRYEQLDADGEGRGFLIGVQIKEISDDARTRYDTYLGQLR